MRNIAITTAAEQLVSAMTLSSTPKSATGTIRLLIADDQPIILRGLSLMLGSEADIDVVGLARDGVEVVEMANDLSPDVIIMDLQMPRQTGVEASREIMRDNTDIKIVVLTTFDTDDMVLDAIQAGAHAYLLKDSTEQDVLSTVRAVNRGEPSISPEIASRMMDRVESDQTG